MSSRTVPCGEIRELITGLVDNQISAEERIELNRHLDDCRACATALTLERSLKGRLREAGNRIEAPAGFRAQLHREHGAPPGSLWLQLGAALPLGLRPTAAIALLLLVLVPVALWLTSPAPIPVETLDVYRGVIAGTVGYERAESPDLPAQDLSRAVGGRFVPPVFNMGAFGLYTAGGFQQKVGGRDVLVTIYEGTREGKANMLTCNTFLGDERDIPDDARLVYDAADGRKYFTFSDGPINGVLQRSGDEVCVLVSKLPMDELIRIARSVHTTHQG